MTSFASTLEESLRARFGDERDALRITEGGIFLATPIGVLAEAMVVLRSLAHLGRGASILDAGAGDGRVLVALRGAFADVEGVRLVGVECDEALARSATLATEGLAEVIRGDFLEDIALGATPFSSFDLVVHYPDGNEQPLFDRMAREGKAGALLAFLSPQIADLVRERPEVRVEVRAKGEVTWYLVMHRPRPAPAVASR